jgi:cell fate regulator YaaT (PSP1 superfamily)
MMKFIPDKSSRCGLCVKGCSRAKNKLNNYDWLCDIEEAQRATDFVEVQFKNTRKGYYLNKDRLPLQKGDIVAVESSPGHDIGTVTLTGKLVLLQMKKNRYRFEEKPKKIYRLARQPDLDKYEEAKSREYDTMICARRIAAELHLTMKIGDVEFQGDGNKAIFYYIADERVDFRRLIKILADTFHVRVEMKQIGARQEAGRTGGIGTCGRELCCSTWMSSFTSVATDAARFQDLSMNPQKLAGQCAKLKCCLNYEVDAYVEREKELPSRKAELVTADNTVYYHFKTDIFKKEMTYSTDKTTPANLVTIPSHRVSDIIQMNGRGEKPFSLLSDAEVKEEKRNSNDILGDSVSRFDKVKKKKKNRKKSTAPPNARQNGEDDAPNVYDHPNNEQP